MKHTVFNGRYYKFIIDDGWEYIEPSGFDDVVVIIPVTNDDKLVLVEQYRVPAGGQVIELPAGLIGDLDEHDGEDILEAADRELIEETGYHASKMEIVADGPPSAGSNTLSVKMILATDLRKVGEGGGVAGESIKVHEVPLDEVRERLEGFIDQGFVVDLKIYGGVWFAEHIGGKR